MELNLGLDNKALYEGLEIVEVAGRLTLKTPVEAAINVVGKNVKKLVEAEKDRATVVLTGPMAVWAYLIVFHAVVHSFHEVYYADGKGSKVLIAMH